LHINTLEYFREYRDSAGELRGDAYEGVSGILQPSELSEITIGGHAIKDLAAPLLFHPEQFGAWNLFCMYAVSNAGLSETISAENILEMKRGLQIHEHCFGLGAHLVLFTNPRTFLERTKAALERSGRPCRMDRVEYYDEKTFHVFF
jgi:hypothetical protein